MTRPAGRTAAALTAALMLLTVAGWAQDPLPPREPSPLTVRQIHSGHSLSDAYGANPWPGRLILATETRPGTRPYETIHRSSIPGAPMFWRWENPSEYPDARHNIDEFELLVITESVPLKANEDWFKTDTLDWLDRWVAHAWQNGNRGRGAEVMLYSTWTYWRHSGEPPEYDHEADIPFRRRLDIDGARWERMQDSANAHRPRGMPPVYMIPGHRLMMRIYDDIEAGRAPGLSSIGDIFADDIHLNSLGQYAITCLVYAVIYQRNPRELPNRLAAEDRLSGAQAQYFKTIAWEVATSYRRSGVPPK